MVLALGALALGWRFAVQWKAANQRYAQLAGRNPENTAALPVLPGIPELRRVSAGEVVAKNLFSPDRNNTLQQETAARVRQPVPVVFGTMKLGESYEALMSEAAQGGNRRFRRVKVGEQFAGYTVAEIRDEAVVVESEGQRTTVNVYESAKDAAPRVTPAPAGAPASAPVVESSANAGPPPTPENTFPAGSVAPAASTGAPLVLPPDVTMTIEGSRRRYVRRTPFGPQVWYEEIPK
jgi:hypothetical protein